MLLLRGTLLGFIYKITNNKNGKVYIGQTINKVSTRWTAHKKACSDSVKALWADPVYRANMLESRRAKAELRKAA